METVSLADCVYVQETRRRAIPRYHAEADDHIVRFNGEAICQLVTQEGSMVAALDLVFENVIQMLADDFAPHDKVGFELCVCDTNVLYHSNQEHRQPVFGSRPSDNTNSGRQRDRSYYQLE